MRGSIGGVSGEMGMGREELCPLLIATLGGRCEHRGIQPCLLSLLTGSDGRYHLHHPHTMAAP